MKKALILAVLGVCLLASTAFANDRDSFWSRVQRFTGSTYGPIRGLCICKEAGTHFNKAGVLISSPGPAGSFTGIGVGCAVMLFYSSDASLAPPAVCNTNFLILGK